LLADLISELRENLNTSLAYYSGSPGNRSYISPFTDFWRQARNQLRGVIGERLFIDVENVYERIQRWKGIVDSPHRVSPDIGNPEVDSITTVVRNIVPILITKLESQ
jgi:hypothetical protein